VFFVQEHITERLVYKPKIVIHVGNVFISVEGKTILEFLKEWAWTVGVNFSSLLPTHTPNMPAHNS
jgi:hypothetical protein